MQVYFERKPYEVNEQNPTFNYLTYMDNPFIKVKAVIKNPKKMWKEEFKVTSQEVAETQIKEVIAFFNATLRPDESEREFVELYVEDEELSRYEDGDGMSGWLNPDGVFFPCGFGEHIKYAREILNNFEDDIEDVAQNQHIPMSYCSQSCLSHVGILGEITPKQVEWFDRFFDKLSTAQKFDVKVKLNEQGHELTYDC